MSKKKEKKTYPKQYFDVLKMFHLTPDFEFSEEEKDFVKYIDKNGPKTSYELSDKFDLRPSKVKEIVASLTEREVLYTDEEGHISLTENAIKYVRATKEERKAEKKFRKFLDTLDEADFDKLLKLVNSFEFKPEEVKEALTEDAIAQEKPEEKEE